MERGQKTTYITEMDEPDLAQRGDDFAGLLGRGEELHHRHVRRAEDRFLVRRHGGLRCAGGVEVVVGSRIDNTRCLDKLLMNPEAYADDE